MGFTFKCFHIEDSRCGMKVCTDSILLGSLVETGSAQRILDIGCGSGLLALMLAQRTQGKVKISGIEIDAQACEQANENIQRSPWPDAVSIYQMDVNAFCDGKFDLIISNPPYFSDSLQSPDAARNIARHGASLSREQLAGCIARLLDEPGYFWLILPVDAAEQFLIVAKQHSLYCHRLYHVHTKQDKPVHRQIMVFAKIAPLELAQSDIAVYDENNQYSSQFIALTENFYLNR